MNKVELIGRLTKEPTIEISTSNIKFTKFNLAVQRTYKDKDGKYSADFISCVAWEKTAESICKNLHKGDRLGLVGHIQSRNYEQDGAIKYALEIMVDSIYYIDYKKPEKDDIDF